MSFDEERHDARVPMAMPAEMADGAAIRRGEHRRIGTRERGGCGEREPRTTTTATDWREVDRQLRRIARRRAAIDAEEAPWLLAAHRGAVHVELGHATFVEYVERVLGYGPRVALDRLRVAEALEVLPATRAALAAGDAVYSAVRELTRVATAATEDAWLAAAAGKTVHEVEAMVSGHRPGDLPDDPTDPDLRPRVLRFEVAPETFALFREAEHRLASELGHMLSDDELIAALCQAALVPTWARKSATNASTNAPLAVEDEGCTSADAPAAVEDEQPASADVLAAVEAPAGAVAHALAAIEARIGGLPRYQVAITTCTTCKRGWQDGAGQAIEIGPAAIATALCDAQVIGDVNRPSSSRKRATRTIPPATRRQVLRRDHGRCVVPGCRRARWIDLHHRVPRARGGSHDPLNVISICSAHHHQAHTGRLVITGDADALVFHHADGRAWGSAPGDPQGRVEPATTAAMAPATMATTPATPSGEPPRRDELVRGALRKMGWSAGEAASATARASARVDEGAPIEAWIVAALGACRKAGT